MCLRDMGGIKHITVYDPVFTPSELTHLSTLNLPCSPDYSVTSPCLLYMVHCHLDLYESVLLSLQSCPHPVLLIGNSLRSYSSRISPLLTQVTVT